MFRLIHPPPWLNLLIAGAQEAHQFYLLLCHFLSDFFLCTLRILPWNFCVCLFIRVFFLSGVGQHHKQFLRRSFHSAWINFIWGNKHLHLISDSKQMNKQNQMCNKMPKKRTDWKLKEHCRITTTVKYLWSEKKEEKKTER